MATLRPLRARGGSSLWRLSMAAILGVLAIDVDAAIDTAGSASALRADYASTRAAIEHSAFGRPLTLESTGTSDALTGDIRAVMSYPFASVRDALNDVETWCEIMILHPNIESCEPRHPRGVDAAIDVDVGRAHLPVSFSYRVITTSGDYLHVQLAAPEGPMGTTDYRIVLEAAPLDAMRTLLHFSFSHGYGVRARLAMKAYLATFGRGKIGFTVVGHDAQGRPRYVDDFRGALERNAMRYYLAIEAYLGSLSAPPGEQRARRLAAWFAQTQRYDAQLHEDDEYLARKRAQLARLAQS